MREAEDDGAGVCWRCRVRDKSGTKNAKNLILIGIHISQSVNVAQNVPIVTEHYKWKCDVSEIVTLQKKGGVTLCYCNETLL